jgi:hypothetical protein
MRQAELPFDIILHDFDANYFPRTQIPESFVSHIELRDPEGNATLHAVNMREALRWRGWKLSQSSFAMLDENLTPNMGNYFRGMDGRAFLELFERGRMAIELTDNLTDTPLPVFDAAAGAIVPVPRRDFFFETPDGITFQLTRGTTVLAEGPLHHGHDHGLEEDPDAPYRAEIVGRLPAAYSGLAVMREPKALKAFFYLCFTLFLVGPLIAFGVTHTRVWGWVDPTTGRALIGGTAKGRRARLDTTLDRIALDLQEEKG